jgi:hypothetical protein
MDTMTRVALISLSAMVLLGLILALLPNPPRAQLGEVILENVDMVLYPAADPNARWTFKATQVLYNPETRESVASGLQDGKRYLNVTNPKPGQARTEVDLSLKANEIRIDASDNLNTQQAEVYIYKGCWTVKLGKPDAVPVVIDQNTGYRAPYAEVRGPNLESKGGPLTASFDLEKQFDLQNPEDRYIQGGKERCVNGTLVKETE